MLFNIIWYIYIYKLNLYVQIIEITSFINIYIYIFTHSKLIYVKYKITDISI